MKDRITPTWRMAGLLELGGTVLILLGSWLLFHSNILKFNVGEPYNFNFYTGSFFLVTGVIVFLAGRFF